MTKFLTICMTLFMACLSHGQGFNKYYQSGNKSLAIRTQSLNANEYLVTNYFVDSLSGDQGLDLRKIDNQGLSLMRKRYQFYGRQFLTFFYNNIQTNVSNSTILLTAASNIDTASAVIFVSVNKYTLDTNWTRYYADGLYGYYINNVFKVKPNEVWFMGAKTSNSYSYLPVAFIMDTLGNLLATKEFTTLINYGPGRIFYDYPSGRLYIAGLYYPTPSTSQNYITCVDTAGSVVWTQLIGNTSTNKTYFCNIQKKNNYLIISGGKAAGTILGMPAENITLVKVNASNGSVVWQKIYGAAGVTAELTAFVINNDESIVSTGTYEFYNPSANFLNRDGVIFKANSNGDSLWLKSYGTYTGTTQEEFFDIQPTPDGGYMMCGSPLASGNDRSWVVKTDSLGIGPGVVTSTLVTGINEIDLNKEGYTFFPNPATDKIFIQSNASHYIHLILYNNTGELVREEDIILQDGLSMLKINNLANGIYLAKIYDSNNLLIKSSKLIIAK